MTIAAVRADSTATLDFEVFGESQYRLTDPVHGIRFEIDNLRRERYELVGELSVWCGLLGTRTVDGVLSIGTFNLSNPRHRKERAVLLAERSRTKIDWTIRLEELAQRVLAAERAGEPAVLLHTLERPAPGETLDVHGLRLLRAHPVIIFGDGGAAKSYLALYVAGELSRRGLRVLYADWELAGEDHRDRLERLFGPEMPPIYYARCDRPATLEIERLRRLKTQHEIEYLVCDSVAYAADGPPEAADVAARYFRCFRQLGIGSLHVAHTSRGENNDQKPFGSGFWHNSARATWFVKLASTAADGDQITIGLYNRKSNLGSRRPALAFDVTFGTDRTWFKRVEITDVEELAESLPLWQRIRRVVQRKPLTLAAIAEELDANVDSIEKAVKRKKHLFTRVVSEDDGVPRVALLERGAA